jgi:hypothetical protein
MSFSLIELRDQAGWDKLSQILSERQNNITIVPTIVRQLKELNAIYALLEDEYIDRDFSEAYSAFYAKTFRRHSKLCKRVLLFASDISFLSLAHDVKQNLSDLASATFLGQIVLRPISKAPLGQAILALRPAPPTYDGSLQVFAEYTAHIFGAELRVQALPMTQQDSRIGACAQATIWAAARHFHARHRGPWLSTVSITQSAIANSEHNINRSLPAGSEFLTVNNMTIALRSAGREPLIYAYSTLDPTSQIPQWKNFRPTDVIARYLDSGIPVIVGLYFPGQDVGHAILATGDVMRLQPNTSLPPKPTMAEYIEAFYANDDQIGPNIRVSVNSTGAIGEASYNINDNAIYLMVPLPGKVYLPAESAELLAWAALEQYAGDWTAFKARHSAKLGTSESLGDALVAGKATNNIIARTYLTYGWKYKQRGILNKFSNPVRQIIRNLDVPRFVYVTEFSLTSDITSKDRYDRRILAHCVIDATAKHQEMDSILLMHAPGFCTWYSHNISGEFVQSVAAIQDSSTYFPKARGEQDFSNFESSLPKGS